MTDLPDGVVTFLLTDIEGSTRLWEDAPNEMMDALRQHDSIVDGAVDEHDGVSVKPRGEGDSRFLVFCSAIDAVRAAASIQRQLAETEWVTPRPIKIRASLHTGTAELQLGDYYGSVINRAARIRGVAHGGQTVLSRATWELIQDHLPPGTSITDMGEHGLKDLTRPEHIYQLDVDGLPGDFAPLASLDAVANNLPVQLTEFVGRTTELHELAELLGQGRLLTILAPGGTGKTRLAIQAAANGAGDYADGVFFIGLADISSAEDILQTVSESMSLGLSADEDVEQQLLTYLANKNQLLVFDNFEHVTTGARLLSEILRAAPDVSIITTSRSKLNITGEIVYVIGGLETTWESDDEALLTSGVVLFLEAARRVKPDFQLDPAELPSVSRILELTGGSPLAIQLAAAWANMLSVNEIAEEISKSLDFLESDAGDVPDRHRSVRAVFDYSWALLSDTEREIFKDLSVFRGGFTREAAEAVANASLRSLANLVTKALIAPSPETGRFVVHELLRQYAEEELRADGDRSAEVQTRHAEFYATFAGAAVDLLMRADQPEMLSLIEGDLENIRAAWRHHQSQHSPPPGRQFLRAMYFVHEWRGWYRSSVSMFREAERAFTADDENSTIARALARASQGWFLTLLGESQAGAELATSGLADLPTSSDVFDRWIAVQCSVLGLMYSGNHETATEQLESWSADGSPDAFFAAGLNNWKGFVAVKSGDLAKADRLLSESLVVLEERDDHYFMTWNMWLRSMIATERGRFEEAIELSGRQVARAREIGYLRGLVVGYEGLGDANLAAGNAPAAEEAFTRSLATAEKMGMVIDMLSMLPKIASALAAQARWTEAVELLSCSIAAPRSSERSFSANVPIQEFAQAILDAIEPQVDSQVFADACSTGGTKAWDLAARDLITGRR